MTDPIAAYRGSTPPIAREPIHAAERRYATWQSHRGLPHRGHRPGIAADLGVHPSTVWCWVHQLDAARRTGPRGRTGVPTNRIVTLRDVEGLSFADIAAAVRMTKVWRDPPLPHRHRRTSARPVAGCSTGAGRTLKDSSSW
ncbi:MAG: hypothetical protein ACRDRD_08185 [Pseudonocardiaceae bacterium]